MEILRTNEIVIGPAYIDTDGLFIDLYTMGENRTIRKQKILDIYMATHQMFEMRFPDIDLSNCIRINDGGIFQERPYIRLSRVEPNQAQYASLKLWIEHIIDSNKNKLIIGYNDDKYLLEINLSIETNSNNIIKQIKALYSNASNS